MNNMNYRILTTGSSGNSVLIENILIDAGLTKKKLCDLIDLNIVEYVFISHKHADHCNLPLIRYFIQNGVNVFLPQGVVEKLYLEGKIDVNEYDNITQFDDQVTLPCGEITVTPVPQKHWDLINFAFVIEKGDTRYLYSTDLDTLEPSELGDGLYHLGQFDVIFLEGNYDEEWLREYIIESISVLDDEFNFDTLTSDELNQWVRKNYNQLPRDMSSGLFRAVQNMRHLSKQQARSYVKEHLKPNGKYYEIHRSSMFYEKPSDWDVDTLLGGTW